MKKVKMVCAGFGGQGVLSVGQLIAMMAMNKNYLVSWMPSYGPEMRGGTANCHVVIDEHDVGSPIISDGITHLLAMNQPALNKFLPRVAPGGVIVANASMVKKDESRPDIQWVMVDFYQIAVESGNQRTQNMAALGSLVRQLEGFSESDGFDIIKEKFGDKNPEMVEVNQKAYTLAYHN